MSTQYAKRNRVIFFIVSFIFWFAPFLYVPVLSPYIEQMGGKYSFIGIVLSSYGLMQLLCRLPIGIFSDLTKLRKPVIIFGMLVSLGSCLAFALTDSLGWVLLSRALAGVAAATWVVFTVLYASYFTNQELQRAMGSISFSVVLAQLLGMLLSGYIVEKWGWHAPFWFGAAVSSVGVVLSLFIFEPKEGISREPIQLKDLTAVMKDSLLLKASLLSILAHSIIFTTMFGFVPTYALSVGLRASDISLIVFSFMIPHALATPLSGSWFVPRLGQWRTLQLAFFCTAVLTILTPFVKTLLLLCLLQAVNGFALGLLFPILLGMAIQSIMPEKRATAMGVYQALYALGMFFGPFLAGILNSYFGIAAGFYFVGILGIVATGFVAVWNKSKSNQALKVET